jgi:hypothetical protein
LVVTDTLTWLHHFSRDKKVKKHSVLRGKSFTFGRLTSKVHGSHSKHNTEQSFIDLLNCPCPQLPWSGPELFCENDFLNFNFMQFLKFLLDF